MHTIARFCSVSAALLISGLRVLWGIPVQAHDAIDATRSDDSVVTRCTTMCSLISATLFEIQEKLGNAIERACPVLCSWPRVATLHITRYAGLRRREICDADVCNWYSGVKGISFHAAGQVL